MPRWVPQHAVGRVYMHAVPGWLVHARGRAELAAAVASATIATSTAATLTAAVLPTAQSAVCTPPLAAATGTAFATRVPTREYAYPTAAAVAAASIAPEPMFKHLLSCFRRGLR